jgi:hypothetical protein
VLRSREHGRIDSPPHRFVAQHRKSRCASTPDVVNPVDWMHQLAQYLASVSGNET